MTKKKIFLMFSNCKIVAGAKRAIICDLQRSSYDFIPNSLVQILTDHPNNSLGEIKDLYTDCDSTIDEYFDFLVSKDYGFWGDEEDKALFSEIQLNSSSPSTITNSIIDIAENSNHNFEKIFSELEELGCRDVQLRFYSIINELDLTKILSLLNYSRIKSVELILKNNTEFGFESIVDLTVRYARIRSVIVHSSPEFKLAKINEISGRGNVIYVKDIIDSASHCGIVDPTNFIINLPTYIESLKYNSCLNGKISIDADGNIKNCPSMDKSFGNIIQDSLKDICVDDEFRKIWMINKDQVEICKDCEFRHICTDCRAYTKEPTNHYSKPLRCNYDPYIAQWVN
jgi:SPASM domain peptide maturase of grasp-with-spasm system